MPKEIFRRLFVVLTILGGAGCSSPDLSGPVSTDPTQLVWSLSINTHAILMSTAAPYDTLQLTAVPRSISGAPLTDAPPITWTASDSSLRVSPTGLVTARSTTQGSYVKATMIYRGIRVEDTAYVNVSAETAPPSFHRLQVELESGDSARVAISNFVRFAYFFPGKLLLIGALDETDAQIPSSQVALRVSDVSQLEFVDFPVPGAQTFSITEATSIYAFPKASARIGALVTVHGSATVYGITREDSLQLLLTPELLFKYNLTKVPGPGNQAVWTLSPPHEEVIGVGGYVFWENNAGVTDSVDVVFDDPTAASPDLVSGNASGGNIAAFEGQGGRGDVTNPLPPDCADGSCYAKARQFLRAGRFPWHSPRTGLSGTVVVQ